MNRVERPQPGGRWLRGAVEDDRVDVDDLEGGDQFEDFGATHCNVAVRQLHA